MFGTDDCSSALQLSHWDVINARSKYGARADSVVATNDALYARRRATGDIYTSFGTNWVRVSGPVAQLAAVGKKLYALTTDSSEILEYSGSETHQWTKIGYEAQAIMACGIDLCATLPGGDFVRYRAGAWSRLGGPAAKYVATSSAIYRLTRARDQVETYSETDARWYHIGDAAGTIYATNTMVLATAPNSGELRRYTGVEAHWDVIGPVGRHFIGVGNVLYGLTPLRDSVQRYLGNGLGWEEIRAGADWLYAGPAGPYITDAVSKDIYRYTGRVWERIGQP
jgi:hypothetical protein